MPVNCTLLPFRAAVILARRLSATHSSGVPATGVSLATVGLPEKGQCALGILGHGGEGASM